MARRRRNALGALAAVEGEKVEYFLPAAIFNASAKDAKTAIAYCMRDVESNLLPYLDYQSSLAARKAEREKRRAEFHRELVVKDEEARAEAIARGYAVDRVPSTSIRSAAIAERTAKTRAKAGDIFKQTADEIRKDLAEIRAQGITGPIPACVYRTSGKYGDKALKTAEARANRFHERFHADTRRVEYRANRPHHDCELDMARELGADLDPELRGFSADYWTTRGIAPVEEILARVEEVQNACSGDEDAEACGQVMGRVNDWFISKKKPELAASFAKTVTGVKRRFSSPLEVVKKACKIR
jgi:hypothetical protein